MKRKLGVSEELADQQFPVRNGSLGGRTTNRSLLFRSHRSAFCLLACNASLSAGTWRRLRPSRQAAEP